MKKRKVSNWNFPWIIIQARFIPFISFIRLTSGPKAFYQAAEGMGGDTGYYGKTACLKGETIVSYGLCSLKLPRGHALTIYPVSQKHYETVCEVNAPGERQIYGRKRQNTAQKNRAVTVSSAHGWKIPEGNRSFLKGSGSSRTPSMEEGLEKAAEEIGRNMSARLNAAGLSLVLLVLLLPELFDRIQLKEYLEGFFPAGMQQRNQVFSAGRRILHLHRRLAGTGRTVPGRPGRGISGDKKGRIHSRHMGRSIYGRQQKQTLRRTSGLGTA